MDFKVANFLAALIVGALSTLSLVMAGAILGNSHAITAGLISSGSAYCCQLLIHNREVNAANVKFWPAAFQIVSIVSWLYAFVALAF